MKNIKGPEEFISALREDVSMIGPNSEKEIRAKEVTRKIQEFNSKRNAFDNILRGRPEKWEEEAGKVIGENEYLGTWWQVRKLARELDVAKKELPTKQGEDLDEMKETILDIEKRAKELENDLVTKQREDMASIQ